MKWLIIGAVLYLGVGLGVLVFKCGGIIDEQMGELYEQKSTKRFKIFLMIILAAVIFMWPLVLSSEEKRKSKRKYVIRRVMDEFNRVAGERREVIDGNVMINITSKFVVVYESIGRLMFREHLKYELEKYRNEGLRPDYFDSTT